MSIKKLLVLLVLCLVSTLIAQTEDKIKLDLDAALVRALQNNHDLKKAKLDFEKAEEQVREAYGTSLFPSLDGSMQYNRALKRPEFIIETPMFSGRFPAGTKNTLTATVSAEQPLFTGAMFLAVDIAETFADISKSVQQYSEAEVIKNVKGAYYTYLLSQRLIELTDLQLSRAEENMMDTEKMYNAGLASEYDFTKAKVQYQNMLPAVAEAKSQEKLAMNNLKILLGFELDKNVIITDSLYFSKRNLPNLESGLQTVIQKNKLIKQLELQTELEDLNASYQFSEHLPKLNAFGNWQVQAQENDDRGFSNWRYINSVAVGLSLSIPIFRGWELDSKVEQAELDYKKAVEEYLKTKKTVKNQFENSVLTVEKYELQVQAYEGAVKEAERGFEIAKKRFSSGLGSQIEVTNALVDFSQAKVNYLQSVHDYYVELANIDLLLGKTADEILNQN